MCMKLENFEKKDEYPSIISEMMDCEWGGYSSKRWKEDHAVC